MNRRLLLNKIGLAAADVLILIGSLYVAFLLRFDGAIPARFMASLQLILLPRAILATVFFYYGGLYRSLWRYAGLEELVGILRVVTLYDMLFLAASVLRLIPDFPRSTALVAFILDVIGVAGLRVAIRIVRRVGLGRRGIPVPERKRVLIVGAGAAGVMVARELLRHEDLRYWPVGFVDDDPAKQGMRIATLDVLGTRENLVELVKKLKVDEVIIAMPSAPASIIRDTISRCESAVPLRIVPGLYDLVEGKVTLNQIRKVQLEDLLGREPVELNMGEVASYLSDRTVLVTGAGGSIGSELCRQISRFNPANLILLGNEENSIYDLQHELGHSYPEVVFRPVIANIRDWKRMESIFEQYQPDVVFHAAAHKHVPLMEAHPDEAVKNNVMGTRITGMLASKYGVDRFVLISTDKAVNPTSVMGATKRVAEMIIQSLSGRKTKFMAVRFGNVLGSRGSVVPLFQAQIARGGPVTVTHPKMVRYFMTIPEAAQLVLQAGALGAGGEVFVLDMGRPIRILELAQNLIRLSGLEPDVDIPIQFSGIRPGEKLFEEILTAEEGTRATCHSRIYRANLRLTNPEILQGLIADLEISAERGKREEILSQLKALVPSYKPPDDVQVQNVQADEDRAARPAQSPTA